MTQGTHSSFVDRLAEVVDGDPEATADFDELLESSDDSRDLLHDARKAAEEIEIAGDDYEPVANLDVAILARIDGNNAKKAQSDSARPTRRWGLAAGGLGLAAAAAFALYATVPDNSAPSVASRGDGIGATLVHVSRAGGGTEGVNVRTAGSKVFSTAAVEAQLAPGTTIRTDVLTRAELRLGDGSTVILDHQTEVTVPLSGSIVRVSGGSLVAEVAKRKQGEAPLVFKVPTGEVRVLGTQFSLDVTEDTSSVRVTRGLVQAVSNGTSVDVNPGQEGMLRRGLAAEVVPATDLASSVSWSELSPDVESGPVGIGELRARKPGESGEKERPLVVASQIVDVRIVGNVARTEITQTFRNDSGDTLEGIYKFPIPSDANIENLALDVKGAPGGFEQGAFVDRLRAQKIWAGVINRATPKEKRKKQELIWVPGPWRDPALLQWQRGGSFELKIFPIPARGQRTVKIAYTQVLAPRAGSRRYIYPLAHASDGSTRVEDFRVNVRVSGHDTAREVRAHGYDMNSPTGDASINSLSMARTQFIPSGDLLIDYSLPNPNSEIRWWTFRGDVAAAPGAVNTSKLRRKDRPDPAVAREQARVAADARPFVMLSLTPALPASSGHREARYAIIVDSSQSMVGERFQRARRLAASVVAEMDRRDQVTVFACDVACLGMDNSWLVPSPESAATVAEFLMNQRPAGSTDIAAALAEVRNTIGSSPGAPLRIIYIGDGQSSTGFRSAHHVAAEVAYLGVPVTTVAIGGDSDAAVLGAIAQATGGHVRKYVPGDSIAMSALGVLSANYGASLEHATVTLPPGLVDVHPKQLPTLQAGQEVIITARLAGPVKGTVRLVGTVDGDEFERTYSVDMKVSESMGNAFVPRAWARGAIDDLETSAGSAQRSRIVAMSKAYGVLSRETSLLVLESQAMFDAFGVDRATPQLRWSGNEAPEAQVGTVADLDGFLGRSGGGRAADGFASTTSGRKGSGKGYFDDKSPGPTKKPRSPAPRLNSKRAPNHNCDPNDPLCGLGGATRRQQPPRDRIQAERRRRPPRRRRPGRWMKREWYRTAAVSTSTTVSSSDQLAVENAQRSLAENSDSRDRMQALVRALSRAGNVADAEQRAEDWLARDQLDPEALTYLSDAMGRRGDRGSALRLLSGIVDLEPDNAVLHRRLANAYRRINLITHACGHDIAAAETAAPKASHVAAAVRCLRATGRPGSAERLLTGLSDGSLRLRVQHLADKPARPETAKGEMVLSASWTGAVDLDISIITPQGTRMSWMGGRRGITADHAADLTTERVGLKRASTGDYVIELSRADGSKTVAAAGTIDITVLGKRQRLEFALAANEQRAPAGHVRVRRRSRLVEAR